MTPANPPLRLRARLWAADGALLGLFMSSVGALAGLLYAPASPLAAHLPPAHWRDALMGAAMGVTLLALVYSPLGAFSGAHMNPAVTLAFLRLGRLRASDAAGYIGAQTLGGLCGALAIGSIMGPLFTDAPVSWATTAPGRWGVWPAFAAEASMAFVLMLVVLFASNVKRLAPLTGALAALLVTAFITFESPVSGMSMNPARTLSSAVPSGKYTALWVYLTAPPLGMLAAAELFGRLPCFPRAHCCKLNHHRPGVCPHCGCDGPIDFDAHADDHRNDQPREHSR